MKATLPNMKTTSIILAGLLTSALATQAASLVVDGTTHTVIGTETYSQGDGGIVLQNNGIVNLNSGSLTLTQSSTNNNFKGIDLKSGSTINVNGGVLTFAERIAMSSDSTFRINGDAGTVDVHQTQGFGGTLDFVFNATGVSTFSSDSYFGFSGTGTLTIDASSYTGPDDTFVLVETGIFNGTYANNSIFDNVGTIVAPTGYTATFDQSKFDGAPVDGFTGQMTLTLTQIPEPATTATLFGLLALGSVMIRRRR
jgi:hypothetical protein